MLFVCKAILAAIKIQALARKRAAQKLTQRLREKARKQREDNAYESNLNNGENINAQHESDVAEAEAETRQVEARRKVAVASIQSALNTAVDNVTSRRQREDDEARAATKIQSFVRSRAAKAKADKRQDARTREFAATKIQAVTRRRQEKNIEELKSAATQIQLLARARAANLKSKYFLLIT